MEAKGRWWWWKHLEEVTGRWERPIIIPWVKLRGTDGRLVFPNNMAMNKATVNETMTKHKTKKTETTNNQITPQTNSNNNKKTNTTHQQPPPPPRTHTDIQTDCTNCHYFDGLQRPDDQFKRSLPTVY